MMISRIVRLVNRSNASVDLHRIELLNHLSDTLVREVDIYTVYPSSLLLFLRMVEKEAFVLAIRCFFESALIVIKQLQYPDWAEGDTVKLPIDWREEKISCSPSFSSRTNPR